MAKKCRERGFIFFELKNKTTRTKYKYGFINKIIVFIKFI